MLKTLAMGMVALGALTACDEVDVNDRFIELPAIEVQRTVLLEEFTGQLCVNCPKAHDAISQLLTQYPTNLVAVSIHAGGDAFSLAEEYGGLRNDEGMALAAKAGTYSYPIGQIDRMSGLLDVDGWGKAIRSRLSAASVVEIDLDAVLADDAKTINITTVLKPTDNIKGTLNLWVVENGIIALQIQPNGSFVFDYEHNHVFRATVNGVDGEAVTLVTREEQTIERQIAVRDIWNADNLAIVAFVEGPNGFEQVAYAHVHAHEE